MVGWLGWFGSVIFKEISVSVQKSPKEPMKEKLLGADQPSNDAF